MSRQSIIQDQKQSGIEETEGNNIPCVPLPRLCAQQSELLLHHETALQKTLDQIKIAFQKTEGVAAGKEEETLEEGTLPRCILSYAWPSDTYQEKEAWLQPFLDFLYEHLATAGVEVHLDFREPEFDTTNQRETIYDIIHRHYRPGTFIVLIGTESLRTQHDTATPGPMQFELDRIRTCLSQADGSVYPLLLSGTRDSAYPDDIAGYIKIQTAENLTYLNLLQQLIDRLYSQDTQSYWEALETSTMLPENTEAINEALSHELHQNRLADLQQTPVYQTIQMQRQKKISECLSAKLFVAFQEAMGKPIQYMSDEHGFMFQRPPENEDFIQRPALRNKLDKYFLQPGRQLLTLTAQGLGGVGKTQLAQHVYLHPPQPYALRAWFQASSREQLSLQYIDLGKAQGVKFADDLPIEEKVARVLRWLEQQPDCLLMYDDVRDKAMLEGLLPQAGSSHILITTRHGKAWPVSQCLDVDVMEPEEAKVLIEKIAGEQDPTDLETLVNALGRLPLALAQAAWYMRQENCAAGAYLTLYQERQVHLMQHTEGLPRSIKEEEKWEKHEAVWVTFDINFEALKQTCPQALLTLNQASWLASTPIPEGLLQPMMDSQKTTLPERLFEWTSIKKHVTAYSLMQMDPKAQTLRMHNLVQDILRDQQAPKEKVDLFKQTCDALDNLYGQYDKEGSLAYRALLEHAECLYRHNATVASLARSIYDDKTNLLESKPIYLGLIYQDLKLAKESLNVFQKQLTVFEKHYGLEHQHVAMVLSNLGNTYRILGDAKKQCELNKRALTITEVYYGPDHPEVAKILTNLGDAYCALSKAKNACKLQERALAILEAYYGADHPRIGIILGSLGNTYGRLGNAKKQCELQKRALNIQEAFYKSGHPEVASTLAALACAYTALGDEKKACELEKRALKIRELHYGTEHPEVACILTNLGTTYGRLGEVEEQRKLQERALAIEEAYYGSNHPGLAPVLANLGTAYRCLGIAEKACKLQERALIILETHYDSDHLEIAFTLAALGYTYHALGDRRKQCELQERGLVILEAHYGPDHPEVASTLTDLGNAYGALGDAKKQCELQERALVILEAHYGLDHPKVASTLTDLGNAYGALGERVKQCELQKRAFVILKAHYGLDHLEVAETLNYLAVGYGSLNHLNKAVKLAHHARNIVYRLFPQGHPRLETAETFVTMLEATQATMSSSQDANLKYNCQQLSNLGEQFYKGEDYVSALPFFHLALQQQINDPQGESELAACYFNLGSTLFFLERYEEAKSPLENAYQLRLKLAGPLDSSTQEAKAGLDVVLEKLQTMSLENKSKQELTRQGVQCYYTAALALFQQALALQQQSEDTDAEIELAVCYFNVGSALFFLERHEEAKLSLKQCYQLRFQLFGPGHVLTQKVGELIDACDSQSMDSTGQFAYSEIEKFEDVAQLNMIQNKLTHLESM